MLKRLNTSADDHLDLPTIHRNGDADSARAAAISTKLEEGNITAAVMILCPDDRPADFASSNLDRLSGKHPSEYAGARPSANPAEKPALQVSEIAFLKAVRYYPDGSAGGPDGIRPQRLRELVQSKKMEIRLLTSHSVRQLTTQPEMSQRIRLDPVWRTPSCDGEEDRRYSINCGKQCVEASYSKVRQRA